ncbi:tetratricopeptide repeat protein 25-like isoform X2 [Centruroides sculpturatus]|uniref:tetratricopeptide repeat protein 25-like isoform X2 n=1 Tax=Centruroides sculpturatus TaxID=218467 RepID=UPI000C6EDFE8|nr:tetratricopeptide repeat protein 25-like isoform X2 [Centruroides sculpturatus]
MSEKHFISKKKKRENERIRRELESEGMKQLRLRQYELALPSFNKALQLVPKNVKCLTYRSKCHLLLGINEEALKDIEEAMKNDPNNIDSIKQIAETLYLLGDFEHALVYFQRGYQLRSNYDVFKFGIQKCQEAINNAIGAYAPFELTEPNTSEKIISTKPSTDIFNQSSDLTVNKKLDKKYENISRLTLEKSDEDRKYLNALLSSKELLINKTSYKNICRIKSIIKDTLKYLKTREEFWTKQQPIYSRETGGGTLRTFESKRTEYFIPKKKKFETKKMIREDMINLLKEIDKSLNRGCYRVTLNKCKEVLKAFNTYYGRKLENKNEITAAVFSQMGIAHLELQNFSAAISCFQKDLNIVSESNLTYAKSIALENLGRAYAASKDYNNAIETWKQKIPLCKEKIEETWLYHEIGRAYIELGQYVQAIEFGKKAMGCAGQCYNSDWKLNCTALVAQAYIYAKNIEEGIKYFKIALSYAKLSSNYENVKAITEMLYKLKLYNNKITDSQQLESSKFLESFEFQPEENWKEESWASDVNALHNQEKKQTDVTEDSISEITEDSERKKEMTSSIECKDSNKFLQSDDNVDPQEIKYSTPIKDAPEVLHNSSEMQSKFQNNSFFQSESSKEQEEMAELSDDEKNKIKSDNSRTFKG